KVRKDSPESPKGHFRQGFSVIPITHTWVMLECGVGTVDSIERGLLDSQAGHSHLWALQLKAIRDLDLAQVDLVDGCRSMVEWIASRLDVSQSTARDLVLVAKATDTHVERLLADGEIGLERAVAMVRLRLAGASNGLVSQSLGYDLAGVARLTASLKRIDSADEVGQFESRYLVLQRSLDESALKYWGQAAGSDAEAIEKALLQRSDEFPHVPGVDRSQRLADAMSSICLDSLTGGSEGRAVTVAEVFVDAEMAAQTGGELGVTLSSGSRLGPNTLSEILCTGRVRVIVQDNDGRPIGVSKLGEAIPPAIRAQVWRRDQGHCVIDGCPSRYRLQPHHIRHRADGGDNDLNNLALICWYHHHVAIHQLGLRLDPSSPPHRRRLIGWRPTTGPP
ncbi:MAG: HNH endonuclease signature motif containing protein, partial [Acidimicrobiia bacterium]